MNDTNNQGRSLDEAEIKALGKAIVGKTFNQLGYQAWNQNRGSGKGNLGEFVEECVYGYAANNAHEADFKDAGIELKVTGLRRNEQKGFWTAKERLVLCMINFMKDYAYSFYQSPMWEKSQKIFAVFYIYNDSSKEDYGSFRIVDARLLSFNPEDLAIIQDDYASIIQKIKDGLADTISEGDTNYLAACTKGANLETMWTKQPFSPNLAKRRAWSYKPSFMTLKVNEWLGKLKQESIVSSPEDIKKFTLAGAIERKVFPYIGKSRSELMDYFDIQDSSKQTNRVLLNKMLGLSKSEDTYSEIDAADLLLKTVTLEPSGKPQESMSFPAFDFEQLIHTPYEDSEIYDILNDHSFLFVLWQKTQKGKKQEEIFQGLYFWKMPSRDVEVYFRQVYEQMVKSISSGNIFEYDSNGKLRNTFPKASENPVGHVRPHGRNAADTLPLPVKDKLTGKTSVTKQCFWLNKEYVGSILKGRKH
jgi:DNA mismatch repair protein MutH